jgi:hypothetical protein
MQPTTVTRVRHSISSPLASNVSSRCEPAIFLQIQRIHDVATQAQPTTVMIETAVSNW